MTGTSITIPGEMLSQLGVYGGESWEILQAIRQLLAERSRLAIEWQDLEDKRMTCLREGFLVGCEIANPARVKEVVELWQEWRNSKSKKAA